MEQLQNVFEVIKKHHFWILAGLVLTVSLGVYTLAVGKAKTEYKKRESKITSAYKGAQAVTRNPDQPNQEKIGNWETILNRQRTGVLKAWKHLYQKQEKEKQWPKGLGKVFLKKIKEIGPEGEIPIEFRELYRNMIKFLLDDSKSLTNDNESLKNEKLFLRVDYRRPDPSAKAASMAPTAAYDRGGGYGRERGGGSTARQVPMIGVVEWPQADRDKIIADKFDFSSQPSSFRIRLAQENYWGYQALLDIIKKTNGDAKTTSAAAVKAIALLEIGKDAASTIQSNKGPDLVVAEAGKAGGVARNNPNARPRGGRAAERTPARSVAGGANQLTEEQVELLTNRYVDENLMPVSAGEHPYSEFKMMPVLMRLKIDQRKIPDLLVECANSAMPVEVKRYRMNEAGAIQQTKSPAGGRGSTSTTSSTEMDPLVVTIEIHGIIYLYNPPDASAVGKGTLAGQVTAAAVASTTAEKTPTTETPEPEATETPSEPANPDDTPNNNTPRPDF